MKKKVLGLALMASLLVGFNGFAQTTSANGKAATEKTETHKGKEGKKDKKGKNGKIAERKQKNAYEGLNLTEAQKSQLAELDNKRREARKNEAKVRQEKRKAEMAARKDGKKADKQLRMDEKRKERMARMESRKAARKQYLKDVQAIVGQENYVKFLEENYTDGGIKHDKKGLRAGKGKKDNKKGMRDGKKGDKKGIARHSKANMRKGSQYMSHKRVKMS